MWPGSSRDVIQLGRCGLIITIVFYFHRENEFSFVDGAVKGGANKLYRMKVRGLGREREG